MTPSKDEESAINTKKPTQTWLFMADDSFKHIFPYEKYMCL